MTTLLVSLQIEAKNKKIIGLHQTGQKAQDIYLALTTPEQIDNIRSTEQETYTYKEGQNIICLKTQIKFAPHDKKTTYFCSAGFSSDGVSDSASKL